MSNEKEDKVVGIGHNSGNTVSKEAYAKALNSLHAFLLYAQQEVWRAENYLDAAFTKYCHNDPRHQKKLKDFQVHEQRINGKNVVKNFSAYAETHIKDLEHKAAARGVDLDILVKRKADQEAWDKANPENNS